MSYVKKACDNALTGLIFFIYYVWALGTHMMFFPKVTWKDKSVKKLLDGPCILVANHTHHNDGSFIPHVFWGHRIYTLVMTKWYDNPKLHVFFSHLPYLPINLYDADTSWIEGVKDVLKKGKPVLIFPEGKLNFEPELAEFLPGFLMPARQLDFEVPVIPMCIRGGYKLFHQEEIIVGTPLEFDVHQKGRPSLVLKEGAEMCRQTIQGMLSE